MPINIENLKVLLVDNYDSFTFNLAHYLEGLDANVTVVKNDEVEIGGISEYDKLVISPGPGLPKTSGKLMGIISAAVPEMPILGICLGFQAIVEHFKGSIFNQEEVKHGVSESCTILNNEKLFAGVPEKINVGLYHSWAASNDNFPSQLNSLAETESKTIMAFEHESLPIVGIQFHPESILTDNGHLILENFLKRY